MIEAHGETRVIKEHDVLVRMTRADAARLHTILQVYKASGNVGEFCDALWQAMGGWEAYGPQPEEHP